MLGARLRTLLERPTYLLFSGGVDSSLLLALAVRSAREHGLAEPIPITYRYDSPAARIDNRYQDLLVDSLGLDQWTILERGTAEVIGADPELVIREAGLPAVETAYVHLPAFAIVAERRNAVLITGEGGDETFGPQRAAIPGALVREALRHWRRPRRLLVRTRNAMRFARSLSRPPDLRAWYPWLTERAIQDAASQRLMPANLAWSRIAAIDRLQRRGYIVRGTAYLSALASRRGVELVNPLSEDAFVTSLVARTPRHAFTSRASLIDRLWPGLLPQELLERHQKATFAEAYFGDACRQFARTWNGQSLSSPYIDNERLRAAWLGETHAWAGAHLLQAAWAAENDLLPSSA